MDIHVLKSLAATAFCSRRFRGLIPRKKQKGLGFLAKSLFTV